jgi:hypothetical protein
MSGCYPFPSSYIFFVSVYCCCCCRWWCRVPLILEATAPDSFVNSLFNDLYMEIVTQGTKHEQTKYFVYIRSPLMSGFFANSFLFPAEKNPLCHITSNHTHTLLSGGGVINPDDCRAKEILVFASVRSQHHHHHHHQEG